MTRRLPTTTLAIAVLALSACGEKDAGNAAAPAVNAVQAVAAPAGTTWSENVTMTDGGGYRMGNPDAPIKLIEFGSYTCPHCKDFTEAAGAELKGGYVDSGKVSFEYRPFVRDPLDMTVALITRCGGKDVFFPLNDQAFGYQTEMITRIQSVGEGQYQDAVNAAPAERFVKLAEISGLVEWAQQRGMAGDKVRACLADTKAAETLADQTKTAIDTYKVEGTPTIIMNGQKLDNVATWPSLKQRLNGAGG